MRVQKFRGPFKGIYKGSFQGIYNKGSFKGLYDGLGLCGSGVESLVCGAEGFGLRIRVRGELCWCFSCFVGWRVTVWTWIQGLDLRFRVCGAGLGFRVRVGFHEFQSLGFTVQGLAAWGLGFLGCSLPSARRARAAQGSSKDNGTRPRAGEGGA